ncbi:MULTISPECIES: PilW family protein [Psychrobacter]|jgi:type IV pilus assembly protein PilW|uniref:PilW family protein n=1 Tax=Psychrobacter TaxID=497 RepID=UPI000EDD8B20|nr:MULTISPECIES: PilW family protein [Psychrobacter]HCN17816.1 hypothetical protein [Psychrobacter sp.]
MKKTNYPIDINQKGVTLIELMVALVLGLVVSAAALQIFYTSSVNNNRQKAGSQIQDNAVFGMESFSRHLRRANYGANSNATSGFYLNHLTPQGGVVLTRPTGTVPSTGSTSPWSKSNLNGLRSGSKPLPTSVLSTNESVNSESNIEGIVNSDQLTIQYQAYQDDMFSCDGEEIDTDDYVTERYFVRTDTSVTPNKNGLACASLIYTYDEALANTTGIDVSADIADLTGNGMIVIPNVDYFRVLLGTTAQDDFATDPNSLALVYRPIPSDPTILAGQRIVSLQVGLLVHSDTATVTQQENSSLRFNILDKRDQQLNTTAPNDSKYLRNVYETTILIRNARGKP